MGLKGIARAAFVVVVSVALSGCGILVGQAMVSGTGVKKVEAKEGSLSDLKRGSKVLFIAPFQTTGTGFETARGDDAARLAEGFTQYGTFKSSYHFVHEPGKGPKVAAELSAMTPEEVKAKLSLEDAPDYLLTGVITATKTAVAPMKGVVLYTSHTLTFTDLRTKAKVTVETELKELFPEAVPALARALDDKVLK